MFYGILYRDGPTNITISGKEGDTLAIVVENMGRVGYGSGIMRGTKVRAPSFEIPMMILG